MGKDPLLSLPSLGGHVTGARMLATGERVGVTEAEGGVTLSLPPGGPDANDEPDRVVVLTVRPRGT